VLGELPGEKVYEIVKMWVQEHGQNIDATSSPPLLEDSLLCSSSTDLVKLVG
jgi:hypothetical protein